MNNKRIILPVLALISLGLLTHFLFFGHPNQVVFDEVHFGGFISNYYKHEYFFDIHPPLGKLAIAGFGKIFSFTPEVSFAEIGNKFPNKQYLALRFLPNLAGALLPAVIFLLLIEMGLGRKGAFLGGLLVGLENAILTQSLYILLDGFLLLSGFICLYFYFSYRNNPSLSKIIWTAVFGGLAISIKWTGASFIAIPVFMELFKFFKYRDLKTLAKNYALFLIIPFVIYFSSFWIHFSVLYKSGPGDAFMSLEFQKTLINNPQYDPSDPSRPNLFLKFVETNIEMYKANQRLTSTHSYGSTWYTWPFMTRPIFYWVENLSRIYLIGNPIVWWGSTVAILYLALSLLTKNINFRDKNYLPLILIGAYFLNILPFIGVKRVMFLYHYFSALIFGIMILAYLAESSPQSKKIMIAIAILSFLSFIFFSPLSYGLPLSPDWYEAHVWLKSWK